MTSAAGISRINPFKFELQLIEGMINPRFPSWALTILIAFAILRGMLILICIAIMVIPLGKGHASRKKHWFLFRRIYPQPGRGIPYVVPNRSILVVCELCSSVLYLLAACENFKTYRRSGLKEGSSGWYLTLWYGLTWLPSYLGIMLAATSLCYSCLCDVNGNKKRKIPQMLTPTVYNSAWTLWIIITISLMAFWTVRMTHALSRLEAACIHTFKLLQRGANLWDADPFQKIPLKGISASQLSVFRASQNAASVIDGWVTTWVFLAVSLTIFYLFTVQLLIRMLKQVLRKRAIDSMAVDSKWSSPIWQELEQELRFLFKSSILVTLSIISQISELAYQTHSARNLTDINWRIGSALITQLPGIFMTPALLVQSWRIFTERSEESNFHKVPMTSDDQNIPEMTSQLLGWDTTVCWGKEMDLDVVNFPGLYEIQSTLSKEREDVDQKDKQITLESSAGDISVRRLITVTHEEI